MRRPPAETPLMRQYLDIKEQYPDSIVFFRLGDFYEMFFEDALVASKLLDLTLTTRDKGLKDAVPMCGVPHHSARGYIARLIELGHKIVICEQVEDPRLAKGIVKREVVRVVTPGVVLDEDVLDAKQPRYLAALTACGPEPGHEMDQGPAGLAFLDVTTGEFRATQVATVQALMDELSRVGPREVLVPAEGLVAGVRQGLPGVAVQIVAPCLDEEVHSVLREALGCSIEELGLAALPLCALAAASAIAYARATQRGGTLPVARLLVYRPEDTLVIDEAAKTHLELVATLMDRKKQGSLLGVLDQTFTAPGGRLLRHWLLFPLGDVAQIRRRQDAVEFLVERAALRSDLRKQLREIHDLERLAGRAQLGTATPRDLTALARSLERVPAIASAIGIERQRAIAAPELLAWDGRMLRCLADVAADVGRTLVDDPPAQLRDGGVVRPLASAEIDELRQLADGGKGAILEIEARERSRTGISSLKIRYNRVFGYYLEVTRANLKDVPADYIRKQTLANAERFVTPELADLEAKVLGAEERLSALEAQVFEALRQRVAQHTRVVLAAAESVAILDVCAALAEVAHHSSYTRPVVDDSEVIEIEEGRHPVVEQLAQAGSFVPNDCRLDPRSEQVLVITGPNMAGKSTYMRQVAQIVLLSQMGSFVPAKRARIGVCDRVFTRVGASDNLARGDSTFMVEMRETARILRHATRRSLVVLDEIGRGTSTYDGVSIAFAVAEYLHDAVLCKTLFATHYHELCALPQKRPRVRNVSVAVREHRGEVVFLRKVVPGGASRSYGIEVARLAGLPRSVLGRARQILTDLERPERFAQTNQLSLLEPTSPVRSAVELALGDLDPNQVTPIQALKALVELKQLLAGDADQGNGRARPTATG